MLARLASARLFASAIFFAKSGSIPGGSFEAAADEDVVAAVELDGEGRGGSAAAAGGAANEALLPLALKDGF